MEMEKEATKSKSAKWWVIGILTVLLIFLVVLFFTGGEKIKRFAEQNLPQPEGQVSEEAESKTVTLFLLSASDDLLHKEKRQIISGPSVEDEAGRVLSELIRGSEENMISPLPQRTQVRQVYVTKEGIAYADFSRALVEDFAYGSSAELSAVYAIVNSLAYNFKAIKKVVILVEGGEKDTLGGHVDLSRPLSPNYRLVAE